MKSAERGIPDLPANFLNAYTITNATDLAWGVRLYNVERVDEQPQTHQERGAITQPVWGLRKKYRARCAGYGFVIDVSERTVVVPEGWDLPSGELYDEYRITLGKKLVAAAVNPAHNVIVSGILREAMKKRFKEGHSEVLGPLWRDFSRYCQMPAPDTGAQYLFCRRIGASAKLLRGRTWVVEVELGTATLDSRTLADYYARGEVQVLADMISAKLANRTTRRHGQVAVRLWVLGGTPGAPLGDVHDLESPAVILDHAALSRAEQQARAGGSVRCQRYGGSVREVPLAEARLVLDTQITQADHAETILEPEDRVRLSGHVRDFLDGADASGLAIRLDRAPISVDAFPARLIPPPAVRVRGREGEIVIPAPVDATEEAMLRRMRDRSAHVRRHGFLEPRPINPLLACPRSFGEARAVRMAADLNYLLRRYHIPQAFSWFLYRDVQDIARHIDTGEHDALLAVLPESTQDSFGSDNTHERIKRAVEVPSQCILQSNTLPLVWCGKPYRQLKTEDPKLERRIAQRYELCLINLLVKHHWVPFAPAEPFFYNVQIGLDVGGKDNTHAMACLGHGFSNPASGLVFLPEEIPIVGRQTEPIPPEALKAGLCALFERAQAEILATHAEPDFERVIFYRDGPMLGRGDEWNERDALVRLHAEARRRGWASEKSVWTVVEVMKEAEGWRVFSGAIGVQNPAVGLCVFPFEDDTSALVCTTGRPYLPQGTSEPLKIQIRHLHGSASSETVVRDLVWQADLGYTKPDAGLSLPWVLHVADRGALQVSKSYRVSGVTA